MSCQIKINNHINLINSQAYNDYGMGCLQYYMYFDTCNIVNNPFHSHCMLVSLYGNCIKKTGPRSAVGNVSGYRCEADCRSRGRKFDPIPVPYFRGD